MTTTFASSDTDMSDMSDLNADCRNCCDTGMVVDSESGEASACPACRTIDSSADPRTYWRKSTAEGSDSGIRSRRLVTSSSSIGAGTMTAEDLRVTIAEARRRASVGDMDAGMEHVSSSCLLALADLAVEYLEAERRFGEVSCMVMRGESSEHSGLEACARQVAVAEVALRSVTGATPASATCQDLVAVDASTVDDRAVDGRGVDLREAKSQDGPGRWWSRIWHRSRSASASSP